jgi:hypothetical protein
LKLWHEPAGLRWHLLAIRDFGYGWKMRDEEKVSRCDRERSHDEPVPTVRHASAPFPDHSYMACAWEALRAELEWLSRAIPNRKVRQISAVNVWRH